MASVPNFQSQYGSLKILEMDSPFKFDLSSKNLDLSIHNNNIEKIKKNNLKNIGSHDQPLSHNEKIIELGNTSETFIAITQTKITSLIDSDGFTTIVNPKNKVLKTNSSTLSNQI